MNTNPFYKVVVLKVLFLLVGLSGWCQTYQWANSIGGTFSDYPNSIALDGSGNIYMTGYFEGIADFDPGPGTANLTSVGAQDIFFAKYDNSGNYLWAKDIGSAFGDYGTSIALDGMGNVFLTGIFSGMSDFDPGPGTANLTAVGSGDIFFAKYDNTGNYLWAKSIGGTLYDYVNSIALDGSGNIYVTGTFGGIVDFDPGPGTANLTAVGSGDIFFAKYDNTGNYLWAKGIGSINSEIGWSMALDGSGSIYLNGWFEGTADFDPGPGTANLTSVGVQDIFFAKYDNSGNYLWAKCIGSTNIDVGYCITLDGSGNIYATGYFEGIADFDPGPGTANLTSVGAQDIFFAKYDNSGNYLWAKSIGSTGLDEGLNIALDGSGNVYLTGDFSGTADFDPSVGIANLTSVGFQDMYFAKYNSSGIFLWAKNIGSINSDVGYCITLDGSGNVYITGTFANSADFDTGPGTAILTPLGFQDIFFVKYNEILTDINENSREIFVSIYPNPFSTKTTLRTDVILQNETLTLVNTFGQTVAQIKNISGQTITFSRDNLPAGLYFARLTQDNQIIGTVKLVILDN